MKKTTAFMLIAALMMQFLQTMTDAGTAFATEKVSYEMLDISDSFNAVLYTEEGNRLGTQAGSGVYFPATKQEGYTIADSVGTGISKSRLAENMSDGVLSAPNGTKFQPDMSGAVMMGTGLREWSVDVGKCADGVSMLMFNAYSLSQAQLGIYAYYEDGTVEEDKKLFLAANNVQQDNDVEVYTVNAAEGTYAGKKYAHTLTMDFENGRTKKIDKIKIVCSDSYVGVAVMAVTLVHGVQSHDYTDSVPMDISKYSTGKYIAEPDEEIKDLNAAFLANTTAVLNGKYYKRYFDSDGCFMHNGIKYRKNADNRTGAVYTYASENHVAQINMDKDYYKNIAMLVSATPYGGNYPSYQNPVTEDIPCTFVYEDGTKEQKSFDSGFWKEKYYYNLSEKTGNPVIFAGSVEYDVDWSDGKIISKTETVPEDLSAGFVYAVEIPVNPDKILDSILVGDTDKRVFIFALTGVRAESDIERINRDIEAFLSEPAYDALYEKIDFIKKEINEALALGADFADFKDYDEFCKKSEEIVDCILNKGYAEIFAAPYAADKRNGSEENPFYTQKEIKRISEVLLDILPGNTELHIVFDGGTYFWGQTVEIEKQSDRKLVLRGKAGENVIFCGAEKLEKDKFKRVSDRSALAKLPQSVRENVLEYTLSDVPPMYTADITPGLFADGEVQKIAKYPNDGYTSIKSEPQDYTGGFDSGVYTQVELYDDAGDWRDARYAYAEGYFAHDYDYRKIKIDSFDNETKRLTIEGADRIDFDVYPQIPRRLRIVNLLEELDSPGEWYYDKDLSKLYWYPDAFESIDDIRLTMSTEPMLKIKDSRNIELRSVIFAQNAGTGIRAENVEGFSVNGCNFDGILADAVFVSSGKNCTVKNCVITGSARGIVIDSGDFENLTASGNVIENNILYHIGYGFKYGANIAVRMMDTGGIIRNNTISDCPSTAISYTGNDIKIYKNEIFDVCSETNDASAIYSGRKYLARGNEIYQNYIHDILTDYGWSSRRNFGGNALALTYAVYLDDGLSHQSVRENIIKNVPSAFDVNCGQFNVCTDNIIIGTRSVAFYVTSYNIHNTQRASREEKEWAELESNSSKKSIYLQKYPELLLTSDDEQIQNPEKNRIYYIAQPANNNVSGNLFVACGKKDSVSKENVTNYGFFENNIYVNSAEFADEAKEDYRIKQGAQILTLLPGLPEEVPGEDRQVGADFAKTKDIFVMAKNGESESIQTDFGSGKIYLRIAGEKLAGSTVYCAAYDALHRLISLSLCKSCAAAAEFCVENKGEISSVEFFVWDRDMMSPMCEKIEIRGGSV